MEPIRKIVSRTAVLPFSDIDTDQIIPARFLRSTTREGFGKNLFADWRESGCSMCIGMNGDNVASGKYSVSTSNRNFEGRQGVGARTLLASPLTAAASAIAGRIADPRHLL